MSFKNQNRILVILALLLSWTDGRGQPAVTPSFVPPLSNWMSHVEGIKKLSELSIPGSHDTCALYEPFPSTARCQTLALQQQLEAGVRFLDIRCRHVHDAFKIFHGSADQRQSFEEVLFTCSAFLTNHPTECILMSIQQEYKPDGNTRSFEQTFDVYVNASTNLWYLKDGIPTMDEARGKVVLFRRFPASMIPKGIAASDWRDNTNFWIGHSLRIQDNYVVKDKQAKWDAVQALFKEIETGNRDGNRDVLYLNFTSGYQPGLFGIPNINAVSDFINPKLSSYFVDTKPSRCGIVVMDFADPAKCALVVAANHR